MHPFALDNSRIALHGKKILLGITGSIAAYKSCELVRQLKKCGAEVRVVLSDGAKNFVTPTTLETLSGAPVLDSMWSNPAAAPGTHHIDTARWADIALIAPATANMMAKLAHGFCDDLLTTELLAFTGPVFIAPAMNPAMWAAPATVENATTLYTRGVRFLGPDNGETACGEEGVGRMMEPDALVVQLALEIARSRRLGFSKRPHLLITMGPTRSYADPVRFLTNRSSGKMGAALAWAAVMSGCEVTCVAGPLDTSQALLPPVGCRTVSVETSAEMYHAATELWRSHDLFIGAAAVLDWEFEETQIEKIKKGFGAFTPRLIATKDILKHITANRRQDQYVLGFAAETHHALEHGREKLQRKNCDAIFINDVSHNDAGFEADTNKGFWVDQSDVIEMPLATKILLAQEIISKCLQQWQNKAYENHSLREGNEFLPSGDRTH